MQCLPTRNRRHGKLVMLETFEQVNEELQWRVRDESITKGERETKRVGEFEFSSRGDF